MYNPKVDNPRAKNNIPQMRSTTSQPPFFFGGSQVPDALFIPKSVYNGSKGGSVSNAVNKIHVIKPSASNIDFSKIILPANKY